MSRRKGAGYEREVVRAIAEATGEITKRNLDQVRDGGSDIVFGRYMIECKRRAKISIYDWMDQCLTACGEIYKPLVAMRADNRESLVVLRLDDFLRLMTHEKFGDEQ